MERSSDLYNAKAVGTRLEHSGLVPIAFWENYVSIRLSVLLLVGVLSACQASPLQRGAGAPTSASPDPLPAGFDVQGHRGARGLKPENTLPAFETALDLGVTTLELDLHLTADGSVVIWHDDSIDNEKCGLDPNGATEAPDPDSLIHQGEALLISQLTFNQIEAYRCDRNPDAEAFPEQNDDPMPLAGDNYHIVSLEELFQFVAEYSRSDLKNREQQTNASQVQFNMETKRRADRPGAIDDGFDGENPGPFELEILRLIDAYELSDRAIIQSFDHRSLWAIRSIDDSLPLAALTSRDVPQIAQFVESGADIWSPNYTVLNLELVEEAHEAGLQVIPWTVNESGAMRDLIAMGVDGIISDRPDILLNLEHEE